MKYIKKVLQNLVFVVFFLGSFSAAGAGSYEAFFRALERDDVRTVQRLQALGFDLNTPSPDLEPPLYLAIAKESYAVAGYLAAQPSVDVEARSPADESPLMMAALKGQLRLVQALIDRKAHVNKLGWTPLHYAATHSERVALEITRLMLEHHAYIDAASPNGSTPLMMAARYGRAEVVQLLLEEGADPLLRNQKGLSAIDFAHSVGREEVAEAIAAFVRKQQPRGSW